MTTHYSGSGDDEFESSDVFRAFASNDPRSMFNALNDLIEMSDGSERAPNPLIMIGIFAAQSGIVEHVHDVTMIYRSVLDTLGARHLHDAVERATLAFDSRTPTPKVYVAIAFDGQKLDGSDPNPEDMKVLDRALVHVINASENIHARYNEKGILEMKVTCTDENCTVHDHSKGRDIEAQIEQFREELDTQLGDTDKPFGRWGI